MRRIPTAPSIVLLSLLLCSCGRDFDLSIADDLSDRAAIGAIIRDTQEANNAGDVEAWLALFDDDFRYLGPSASAISDRDSLRAMAAAGFSEWQTEIFIDPEDITIADDWAFVHSEVRGTAMHRTAADTVDINLKQLVVYRRTPRGWRISRLAINANR